MITLATVRARAISRSRTRISSRPAQSRATKQQHERDSKRQERDEREEEPLDDVARGRRVGLRDALQRERDERARIRQDGARSDDRDHRRGCDLPHPRDHPVHLRLLERPVPRLRDVHEQETGGDDVEDRHPRLRRGGRARPRCLRGRTPPRCRRPALRPGRRRRTTTRCEEGGRPGRAPGRRTSASWGRPSPRARSGPALRRSSSLSPQWAAMPHAPAADSPGPRRITESPVRNAFGGQVIGSTASARLFTSGSGSPVNSIGTGSARRPTA